MSYYWTDLGWPGMNYVRIDGYSMNNLDQNFVDAVWPND